MKSKGKKFLSALLVSSMVLTSSIGFMPRTAQAVGNSEVYSYDFEYINTTTETGNRKIVLNFDKDLSGIDSNKITLVEDGTATVGVVSPDLGANTVSIIINGVDPSELNYTLKIESGAFEFSDGYQQIEDLMIPFKSYDITPGFKSIFKDSVVANDLLERNGKENIILHVDSDYITDIAAKNEAGIDITEISVSATAEVDSVMIQVDDIIGDNDRKKATKVDDKFSALFSGVTGMHSINVTAYDANGKKLDYQSTLNDFGDAHGTEFNVANVKSFDESGYTVASILDGTVKLSDVLAGKSYADLDKIDVQYSVADNIFRVSDASQLALALSDIGELTDKDATIYLESDITLGSEVILKSSAGRLTIKGNGHTIDGNIELGAPANNKDVRFVNTTVTGNVDVNVGEDADAYLTDLSIGGDLIVTSGDYTSVFLLRVTSNLMKVNNDKPVHIVAYTGTTIGSTELTGENQVKLTMAGGTFGTDVLNKMTTAAGKLVLEGDKNKAYDFEKVTIDATATATHVQLLENTKVLNFVANKAIQVDGHKTSEIVKSADSTKKITYDGFVIKDASNDASKYAGTNVPSSSGSVADEITIPKTNVNTIRLGGNLLDGLTSTQVNAGQGYLTLTIDGNVNWKDGITSATLHGLAGFFTETATGLGTNKTMVDAAADYTVAKLTDKVLKITFDPDTNDISEDIKDIVKIDPSKLTNAQLEPDQSIIGTDDWAKADPDTDFDSIYRPKIAGTDDFVVYSQNKANLDTLRLNVKADLSVVTVVNSAATTYEYKTNKTEWTALPADGNILAADAAVITALLEDEVLEIQIRPLGAKDDDIREFEIKKNEPWLIAVTDLTPTLLANEKVHTIYFSDETTPYTAVAAVLTLEQLGAIQDKAASSEGFRFIDPDSAATPITVNISAIEGLSGTLIDAEGGMTLTADTAAPDIAVVANLGFDNETGIVKLSTADMKDATEGITLQVGFGSGAVPDGVIYSSAQVEGADGIKIGDAITGIPTQEADLKVFYRTVDFAGNKGAWTQDGVVPVAANAGTEIDFGAVAAGASSTIGNFTFANTATAGDDTLAIDKAEWSVAGKITTTGFATNFASQVYATATGVAAASVGDNHPVAATGTIQFTEDAGGNSSEKTTVKVDATDN